MDESTVGTRTAGASAAPSDQMAPLQLIREKESELSRRVLSAKREADEIIAEARRQAAAVIQSATEESGVAAREHIQALSDEAESQAQQLITDADREASELTHVMEARLPEAAEFIVGSVIPD